MLSRVAADDKLPVAEEAIDLQSGREHGLAEEDMVATQALDHNHTEAEEDMAVRAFEAACHIADQAFAADADRQDMVAEEQHTVPASAVLRVAW